MSNATNLPAKQDAVPAMPAYLVGTTVDATVGMEWAKSTDFVFPRLKCLNGGEKMVKEGLANACDMWHTVDKRVYCPRGSTITVYPVKVQREYLHWASRDSGKGLIEKSTDANSSIAKAARKQFEDLVRRGVRVDVNKCDSFSENHAWLFVDAESMEPFVVNLTRGNIAESTTLLSKIAGKQTPMQAFKLRMLTFIKKPRGNQPDYPAFDFKQVGWAEKEVFDKLQKVAENLRSVVIASDKPDSEDAPLPIVSDAADEVK